MRVESLSEEFYKAHAHHYARIAQEFIQSVYTNASHPALTSDLDLMARLKELMPPGGRGLDAGCGAGARDVVYYWRYGYNIVGLDADHTGELEPAAEPGRGIFFWIMVEYFAS